MVFILPILISIDVYAYMSQGMTDCVTDMDSHIVKGREQPVRVY